MSQAQPGQDFATLTQPGNTPKITSLFDFSAEALEQFRFWLEQNPPNIPITQILGFTQFTAQAADRINTSQSTTSTAYVALATQGPILTGLSDGKYLLMFGAALASNASTGAPLMNLKVNGTTPSDDNEAVQGSNTTFGVSASTAVVKTLSNAGNNTVEAVYRTSNVAVTASFNHRWLVALRYSNA